MLIALALPLVLAGFGRFPVALPVQDDEKAAALEFVTKLAGEDGQISLEEMQRGLAEIELLVVVDRKFHAADYRLEEMRQQVEKACRAEPLCVEFREACVLGLLAHVELQLARGYVQDAKNELPEPPLEGSPAHSMDFLARDARVVQLASYVDRRIAGDTQEGEGAPFLERVPLIGLLFQDDQMDEAVGRALQRGNFHFIVEMGGSTVSALVRAVEEELDVFPENWKFDALYMLVKVHPPTAAQLMLRHKDEQGLFWRKRVLRALEDTGVLSSPHTWDLVTGAAPFKCSIPALLEVLEEFVEDPVVGTDALLLLTPVIDRGGLTLRLQIALGKALDAADGARRGVAADLITKSYASENLRPALEAALTSDRSGVRVLAAQRLANLPWSDALAQRMDDTEAGVRLAVVGMLHRRDRYTFRYWVSSGRSGADWDRTQNVSPDLGPPQRVAMAQLLRDPEQEIRSEALGALSYFSRREEPRSGWVGETKTMPRIAEPPAKQALLLLADDPSAVVRASLAEWAKFFPTDLATEMLQALADDTSQDVLEQVDQSLEALPLEDNPARAVEVLRIRVGGPLGFDPRNPKLKIIWDRLKRTHEGRELFAGWALEPGAPNLLKLLVRQPRENLHDERILDLSPATYARVVAALEGVDADVQEFLLSRAKDPELQAALLEVAADTGLPAPLRLKCTAVSAGSGNPTFLSRVIQVLRDPAWPEGRRMDRASLHHFGRATGADRNTILLAVLGDPTSSDALIDGLAEGFAPTALGGVEVAHAILERYYENPEWGEPVWRVFSAMASSDEIRDDELIAKAAQHEIWWEPALMAIGALRDPDLLPILEDILRGEKGDERWNSAADAVTGFLTDEAADLLLLAAAGADSGNRRDYFMRKLDTLHEYFQARDYWQRRKALERSREGAVVELYELLTDAREPIRVQAIRGLATFEAVEAIPTLIRLLADPSPAIVEAVEQALERLNRVEPDDLRATTRDSRRTEGEALEVTTRDSRRDSGDD